MVSFSAMHILKTHLLENPVVSLYYKGTAREEGVPFALNTIIVFDLSSAFEFEDEQDAATLCNRPNLDKQSLANTGYSEFKVMTTTKCDLYI